MTTQISKLAYSKMDSASLLRRFEKNSPSDNMEFITEILIRRGKLPIESEVSTEVSTEVSVQPNESLSMTETEKAELTEAILNELPEPEMKEQFLAAKTAIDKLYETQTVNQDESEAFLKAINDRPKSKRCKLPITFFNGLSVGSQVTISKTDLTGTILYFISDNTLGHFFAFIQLEDGTTTIKKVDRLSTI